MLSTQFPRNKEEWLHHKFNHKLGGNLSSHVSKRWFLGVPKSYGYWRQPPAWENLSNEGPIRTFTHNNMNISNTCSTITVIGLSCSVYINKKQDNACKTMSPKSLQFMIVSQFWHGGQSLWYIMVDNSKSGPMHEKGIRSCIPYSTECSCFSTPFPQIPFPCMYSTYIIHSFTM